VTLLIGAADEDKADPIWDAFRYGRFEHAESPTERVVYSGVPAHPLRMPTHQVLTASSL
jgi:hypothetical protein